MINTSKAYQDYVVFVDSKALRERSKAEPSRGDASKIDCAKRSPKGATAGRRGDAIAEKALQAAHNSRGDYCIDEKAGNDSTKRTFCGPS
jgi:hypothetical protein